jgi:hypothetical protein
VSSTHVGFKRVGLHYIAFSKFSMAKTRLVSLPPSKIADLGTSATNFGYSVKLIVVDYLRLVEAPGRELWWTSARGAIADHRQEQEWSHRFFAGVLR